MARWARRAGAFCALAGIAVVVPALITHLCGWPLPRHLPTGTQIRAVLADPLSPGAVLYVLASGIWLTWAMLAVSVAAEIGAVLRGHPAPRLPVLPPAQALAAALVSALALTPAIARTATAASPTAATASPAAADGTSRFPAALRPAELRARHMPAAAGDTWPVLAFPSATGRGIVTGGRVYRVAPGDTLWSIAAAELGNPWRWPEIYHLNRGRPQPDGQRLAEPALIYPGWTLLLPTSSTTPGRPAASHPRPHHPAAPAGSAPAPHHPVPGRHRAASRPPAGHPSSAAAPAGSPGLRGTRGGGIHLPGGGLAGITLAAAISAAVVLAGVQRRRRYRPGQAATSSLLPGDPPLPAAIAALRRAATGNTGDAGLRPPGPDGEGLPPAGSAGVSRPARPGMVALGVRGGQEVSLDIAALGGLGLTGPGATAAARAILAGLLAQALPGQPDGPAEVIMTAADAAALLPGLHDLTQVSVPGPTVAPTLDAALGHAEALLLRRARYAGPPETSGGLDSDAPLAPAAAVLIATPPPHSSQRLRGVLESGRRAGLAGILLGDWPPGTTCHVAADGLISSATPVLEGVRMFHLDAADSAAVLHLIQAACGNPADDDNDAAPDPGEPHPAPGSPAAAPAPRPPTGPTSLAGDMPAGTTVPSQASATSRPPSAASTPGQPSREAQPPATRLHSLPGDRAVRVEVLGALRITAGGREISGGLRKARELLAFLAIHPAGVTGEAISEALWPEAPPGHGTRQRTLALRKLRDLLRAATGLTGPMFVVLAADRYRLDPALITTDITGFQAALDAARQAGDDTARLAAYREAAALYRGPLADGAGYEWAEPYAETARRRALDTWTAIAELLEPANPDQALAALEAALGHDPYNEYLYQRIMRLQAATGRPDAVRRTLALLETRLAELGVTPGAQTRQAAATLLGPPGPPPVMRPPSAAPHVPGRTRAPRPPAAR